MNFHLYQLIILLVSVFMIYQGVSGYAKGKGGQTFRKLAIRLVVWGGMALIAIFPDFSNFLANIIGIKDNVNAVILTGFLLIFLMIFKLLSAIERMEQNISEVTKRDAIKEINK